MLCHKCTGIHFKPIKDHPLSTGEALDYNIRTDEHIKHNNNELLLYLHSVDMADLVATADQGCHFCMTIQCRLLNLETYFRSSLAISGQQVFLAISVHGCKTDMELAQSKIFLHSRHGGLEWDCRPRYSDSVQPMLEGLSTLASTSGSTAVSSRAGYPSLTTYEKNPFSHLLDTSTLSEANMTLASAWKNSCSSHHSYCTAVTQDSILPTRVINVQNTERLVLEDGASRRDEYLTLSYKWGGTKRCLTLTSNIAQHYDIISQEELPKTFQDAVFVTHRLGFKYLWIDALCITHDCQEDLQTEISRMGDIYRGSSLTLFAEAGDSAETGLSVQRDSRALKPCLLHIRATLDGHTTKADTFAEYYPGYTTEQSSLYRRGWVLQEQVLSFRVLKFGHRQIKWECQGFAARESQPAAEDQPLQSLIGWYQLQFVTELRSLLRESKTDQDAGKSDRTIFECWYELAQNYCDRSLTYQTDKLLALAGIVRIIATKYGLTYINGIWKEDYCTGLLWYSMNNGSDAKRSFATVSELSSPSWSWLSQWGKHINYFNEIRGGTSYMMYAVSEIPDSSGYSINVPKPNNERTQAPVDEPAFQHIIMKSLTLHGYFIQGEVDHSRLTADTDPRHNRLKNPQTDFSWRRYVTTIQTKEDIGVIHFDSNADIMAIQQIVCCLCNVHTVRSDSHRSPGITYLAIIPTKRRGQYKRVGIVKWGFPNNLRDVKEPLDLIEHLPLWCRTGPKETITLI